MDAFFAFSNVLELAAKKYLTLPTFIYIKKNR